MGTRKIALVTGGLRGIGLGISHCLARADYDLAVCGLQTEKEWSQVLSELRSRGGDVLYCRTDVGNRQAREAMVEEIQQHYGAMNLLVNNAGIAPEERRDLLEASEESFKRVLRVNLQGPYFLTQAVANWMIEQKRARPQSHACIVNISSISATVVSTARGEYCVSKAGLSMATQLWATRLGQFNIPVYEVRPGLVQTDMTTSAREKYDKLISEGFLLQSRWGTAEDVAKAVLALAEGTLPYSTGQVIMVDGGLTVPRL